MKKIIYLIIFFVFALFIYVQKQLVLNPKSIDILWYSINLSSYYKANYFSYFYYRDKNPRYVLENWISSDYVEYCHNEEKNCLIIPHQESYSSYLWITSVQYVGSMLQSDRLKNLYGIIDNLTNMSPYWTYPYQFGQLMIPIDKTLKASDEKKKKSWDQSLILWKKWINYNCDQNKKNEILAISNEDFFKIMISKDEKYEKLKNPCSSYNIPYQQWFNSFFHNSDWEDSAQNFKLASFHDWVPTASSSMVSIVAGRGWQHMQSLQLWFSQFISHMEELEKAKKEEQIEFYENMADEAITKAIFELQLQLLTQIDESLWNKHDCYRNYQCMLDNWILSVAVKENINYCIQNTEFEELKDIDFNTNNALCFTLSKAIQDSYINENWTLINPRNKNLKFKFDDYNYNTWWVW